MHISEKFCESTVEQAALDWLGGVGWQVAHRPDIAPDTPAAERAYYGEVVLAQRLRDALVRLNPDLPAEALEDAYRKLTRPEGTDLIQRNRFVHRLIADGVTVEYRTAEGEIRGAQARVIDFKDPGNNDWLAVNQFTVVENKQTRRPDVVLVVNGLPLAVLELKNAADEDATIWTAFQQLQTYKAEIPSLFAPNAVLVISDGVEARLGTLTAGREWFKPWRTITGEELADPSSPEMQVVIEGVFAQRRFLDLVRDFIVFEDEGDICRRPARAPGTVPDVHTSGAADGCGRSLRGPPARARRGLRLGRRPNPAAPASWDVRGPRGGPVHGARNPGWRVVPVLRTGRRNTAGQDRPRAAPRRHRP